MGSRGSAAPVNTGKSPAEADPEPGSPATAARALGELFVAMQSGDAHAREAAWAECWERYHEVVWRRVFYVLRTISWLPEPREVAADVTGDVFVGLQDAVRQYREEGRAEQWLKQVAVRTALRARERLTGEWNKRRDASADKGAPAARRYVSLDEQANVVVRQLDTVESDELLELERRIDRLRASSDPRHQRWVEFIELYRHGYGYAEIGERMGLTEGTARNWLVAIRKHLAEPPSSGSGDD